MGGNLSVLVFWDIKKIKTKINIIYEKKHPVGAFKTYKILC